MNCARARRLIPLAASRDIGGRRWEGLQAHLSRCPRCSAELRSMRSFLAEVKGRARSSDLPEWSEPEWRAIMDSLASAPPRRKKRRFPAFFGSPARILGAAAALILLAALALWRVNLSTRGRLAAPPAHKAVNVPVASPSSSPSLLAETGRPEEAEKTLPARPVFQTPAAPAAPEEPEGTARRMVFVSEESGLVIHWILDSEFEWKETIK